MTSAPPSTASVVLSKGGAALVDLLVDTAELGITVTGPQMLFENLSLLTTLSPFEGSTVQRLEELAGCLEGTIHCGLIGIQQAEIKVAKHRAGATLQIGLGPASMYQSELVLRTRTAETFRALISRLLSSDPSRPFFAGLHAVPATGHLEHHHAPAGGGRHEGGTHHEGAGHGHP
ncbi:hypothetical protein [Streptomyces sp. H27-D2]|uniref:hypothetical protein n=1 Tax=Streptomyces sp. H27-D2 TaxID=3046304 RepID=UPI002DBA88D2|nr:hypothetical protein [Streptomyces sp. H27-D2]MEC4017894.1 hypothetical protein [Streptomyces sp. H27-D2]